MKRIILRSPMALLALTVATASPALGLTAESDAADTHAVTPPTCDYGAADAKSPVEFAQFAFLVGDYQVDAHVWTATGWSPARPGPKARWNGRYAMGGTAYVDEWFNVDPTIDADTGRGINARTFDSKSGEWKMMWVDSTTYQVQDLRAKLIDGKLTMWQVYPPRDDFKAEFEVLAPGKWQRAQYKKGNDGGWTPAYLLVATRIDC